MRKALFTLGLTASLLASSANRPSLLDPLWAFLNLLWAGQPTSDAGCGMDPSGRCLSNPQPTPDEGCGMDPSGQCQPNPQSVADAGCGMDPNGCPGS